VRRGSEEERVRGGEVRRRRGQGCSVLSDGE